MRSPTESRAGTLLRISSPGTFWPKPKTENFARVDAKELPELLAKMEEYNGDAITRFAMQLMAIRLCERQRTDRSAVVGVRSGQGTLDYSSRSA